MLILDNLLLSPLLWIFREINESVQKEQAGEAEAVTRALSELYMKLDAGAITEQEFEAEESVLLDRLDAISERDDAQAADSDGDEEEADDSDEMMVTKKTRTRMMVTMKKKKTTRTTKRTKRTKRTNRKT